MQNDPCALRPYGLTGPQIEPNASFWMYCPKLCLVSIEELTAVTAAGECEFQPFTSFNTQSEFAQLIVLAANREDPTRLTGTLPGAPPRRPISRLFNLMPAPVGAVVVTRLPGEQVIRTGRGLARAVEDETPGLWHRHALNYLIRFRKWSPPFQALIWAGLDITIASALQAAWYYKWLASDPFQVNGKPPKQPDTSRRLRPAEYDQCVNGNNRRLNVLFDRPDELNPVRTTCPPTDPGTPRHPAYPSGHSTYAGAASEYLKFFFGSQALPAALRITPGGSIGRVGVELDRLADNIGLGRLWAGIHWYSDHTEGMKLGRVVARLVIAKLACMDLNRCPSPPICPDDIVPPPDFAELKSRAKRYFEKCSKCLPTLGENCMRTPGTPCADPAEALLRKDVDFSTLDQDLLDASRGVQQGGALSIPPSQLPEAQPEREQDLE